ncbi:MAG: diaminopimelate decarboxylase [Actinobacteria bacterium]|nr:diaminopimelate decarboxylase [Actinomycetota bacterium]
MDYFNYQSGQLYCEGVRLDAIAASHGTPAYVYSSATFLHHYQQLARAFAPLEALICYSVKTNSNKHILRLLEQAGAGFDIVSGGELFRVLQAGGDPAKVAFAGVGKTDQEISEAIEAGIGFFTLESAEEAENISRLAEGLGRKVAATLRVNPDVDPKTHKYITTGKKLTKFGVDIEEAVAFFEKYSDLPGLNLVGLHMHIGSQITTINPYVTALKKMLGLIQTLRSRGYKIEWLDLGGGFGADYQSDTAPLAPDYATALVEMLAGQDLRIAMEPGRFISGNAGVLLTRVLYVKQSGPRRFVIVDAAMNDLIRPALYDAFHFIWPVQPAEGFVPTERTSEPAMDGLIKADVVGGICESGDFLAKDRLLPPVRRGDLLAVFTAGAYSFSMASQYNSRLRAPEVLVNGSEQKLIRRRETYSDLTAGEQ